MAQPHIAYCGFNCAACPVFHAAARGSGRTAAACSALFRARHRLLPGQIDCAGCRSDAPAVFCAGCAMRTCAGARGLAHCAACGEYPCAIVEKSLPCGSAGRAALDALR